MRFDTLVTGWRTLPNAAAADGQLFVIADVHGRSDLLSLMLRHIEDLPEPGGDIRRNLVFTGDLIDRGPDSFGAIRLAMGATIARGRRIILPGNHEGALLDALAMPPESGVFHDWYGWGGSSVVDELPGGGRGSVEELREQLRAALPEGFLDHIRNAPGHFRSGDLLMVHAGILPPIGARDPITGMRRMTETQFLAQPLSDAPRLHWAWIRAPFLEWTGGWDEDRRRVVVHGHTIEHNDPIHTEDALFEAVDKTETHGRINLDLGACSNGRLAALEVVDARYRIHLITEAPRYL